MADNQFDEFIRSKMEPYASKVPADMWERISAGKKKRRIAGWWKTGGLLLLVVGTLTTGWIVYNNNEVLSTANSDNPNIVANANGKNSTKYNSSISESQTAKSSTDRTLEEPDIIAEGSNLTSSQNSSAVADNLLEEIDSNLKTSRKKFAVETGYKKQDGVTTAFSNSIGQSDPAKEVLQKSTAIEEEIVGITRTSNALSNLALQQKDGLESKSKTEALKKLAGLAKIDCPPSYSTRRNDWYVEVFGSPDYAFKSVTTNNGNSTYLSKKDSTEKFQAAFTAGVRLTKSIGESLLLKTGLQYSQINEQFKHRVENERRLITVVTTHTIIRNPGDTVVVRDTSVTEQIGTRFKTTNNKYTSLDLPVLLAYEWGNEKWKANLNAGVIFNLRSWQKGEMLDTSNALISFAKDTSTVFRRNLGLGLYAGFSFIKPISPTLDLFAEPYFRYNLSQMTSEKSPFTQKFHSAGINLGIRYKFNNRGQR